MTGPTSGATTGRRGPSVPVRRVLARDALLLLAADADLAVGIVRQRESLARKARDEPNLFAVALRHHLAAARSADAWAIRAQAWAYAGTIVHFCGLVGIPIDTAHTPADLYARALTELAEDTDRLYKDLTLGVGSRYLAARSLRLHGEYAAALRLVVCPATFFHGTGAEPHRGHFLYEHGASLIWMGQAMQVRDTLGELEEEYWNSTRAAGYSTRHRYDFVLGLAAWEQGDHAEAVRGMGVALDRVGRPVPVSGQPGGPAPDPDEDRGVLELSAALALAECLATGERTAETVGRAVELGRRALDAAERVRGRWRVVARSRAPLAVAFRRVYGDIALLAAALPGTDAAELGLRVALSAKQTGFASRMRAGRLLLSPHVSGLVDEIVRAEDQPAESLVGDEASRQRELTDLHWQLEEAVSPMLADTVLPAPADLAQLVDVIGTRYALDYVALPDTLGDGTNWFRALVEPERSVSFEQFTPGPAYAAFFHGTDGTDGTEKWLGRLGDADGDAGPDWRGLARELLPARLLAVLGARTRDDPIELLVSAHSVLSLLPWVALRIDDAGTRLVERAVTAQCPVLTCLSYEEPPPVTGPALVRLVSRAEGGVNIRQERMAWDLDNEAEVLPLHRCAVGPVSAPVGLDGRLVDAMADESAGWQFVHIAAHGDGEGLGQCLRLPEPLAAGTALGLHWPPSVLMASCHVGQLVNPAHAEPLSFVMALLTGGSRCVVAGIDEIPDRLTGAAASRIVDEIRDGAVRLDVALRRAQLDAVRHRGPELGWALLSAYVR
ncbi:CHAT domain-containing protein [Plantactinospora solaniradicis]|uniref:CHAT domain-containing protein n=1 Tax=Plantactinospora solaniradicis TaxID=1723736 RepID=A0ABW1KEC5_9ACTN